MAENITIAPLHFRKFGHVVTLQVVTTPQGPLWPCAGPKPR